MPKVQQAESHIFKISSSGLVCIQKCFLKARWKSLWNGKILIKKSSVLHVGCGSSTSVAVCKRPCCQGLISVQDLLLIVEHPLLALCYLHRSCIMDWVLWNKLQCPVELRRVSAQIIWVAALLAAYLVFNNLAGLQPRNPSSDEIPQ